jgi:hypothetical protein
VGVTVRPSVVSVVGAPRSCAGAAGRVGRRPGQPGDGEGVEALDGVDGETGPGCVGGEVQHHPPSGTGQHGGDGEQPETEPFRLPPLGFVAGEGEHLHPGGEFGGERDDHAPDLILREAV